MNIEIDSYRNSGFINKISGTLDIPLKIDCLEETIELPKSLGSGTIKGYVFGDGVGMFLFNFKLKKDWTLSLRGNPAPLQFSFCMEGTVQHLLSERDIHYVLNPLRGTITANRTGTLQKLRFPKDNQILLAFLTIDRQEYYDKIKCILDDMPKKLATIFSDTKGEKPYFYHSNYSISVAECINEIVEDENVGLVRSTRIEGKTLELLSMQIKQFNDDLNEPGKQVMLRKHDIEKIKAARKILMDNYQNPPTIEELARQSGINQQKLKKGFKLVYNKTINSYSRDKRLEIAAMKLLNGASVREAANEVGYSNQSHFANRFREKYGILPKDYLKNIQSRVLSN